VAIAHGRNGSALPVFPLGSDDMKRTAPLITLGFVSAMCIGTCAPSARAADPGNSASALSMHVLALINDTRGDIDSFSIAPAGTDHWTHIDFRQAIQESSLDYGSAAILTFHDADGCLRDLRTVLSDGRRIFTHNFDLCHFHAYSPGVLFPRSRNDGMQRARPLQRHLTDEMSPR
jgi:hypothetical protein